MDSVELSNRAPEALGADTVAVPVVSRPDGPYVDPTFCGAAVSDATGLQSAVSRLAGFRGEVGETASVLWRDGRPPTMVVGVGVAENLTAQRLRRAAMAIGRQTEPGLRVVTTLAQLGSDRAAAVRAVVDGFLLGRYRYRRTPRRGRRELCLAMSKRDSARSGELRRIVAVAEAGGQATEWVRRLVDTPASDLTPAIFAEEVRSRATAAGCRVRVWSPRALRGHGFGATLGVGAGSDCPPLVVDLVYEGSDGRRPLGLAGKGITFDAGGLNLKRDPAEISWMKSDMAGAASVASAVCTAAELDGKRPLRAILPLAENLPGTGAMRPGDILAHPDGTRTEVVDTDNEGRLVLADAIAYLAAGRAAAVIDVGTLTDGGAMGHAFWGCWGTSDSLIASLVAAGQRSGDYGWRLPLSAEYGVLFDSNVADLTNCARDVPDTGTMAATYLRRFAGETPWAHIDNGSTAYLETELGPWPRGATGSPTRALLEFLLAEDQ